MLYFDENGFYSETEIESRSTEISLPDEELKEGFAWNFTGYRWVQVELNPVVVPIKPLYSKITQLAFLNRFKDSEAIAIDLASIGATVQAASIRRYLQKVQASTFIDLQREDLRNGVSALQSLGILTAARVQEILDSPVQEIERYKE